VFQNVLYQSNGTLTNKKYRQTVVRIANIYGNEGQTSIRHVQRQTGHKLTIGYIVPKIEQLISCNEGHQYRYKLNHSFEAHVIDGSQVSQPRGHVGRTGIGLSETFVCTWTLLHIDLSFQISSDGNVETASVDGR
jgi:hypothetical protein